MVSLATFRKHALLFPEATEAPHFEKISFRVKQKIFATYDELNGTAVLKLSVIDQSVFSAHDKTIIYPVPNGWGKQGSTIFVLRKVNAALFLDALTCAYCAVAPKKLADQMKSK